MLNPQQTVASLVLDHSECAPVFQRHRIDYCCRGDASIAAASRDLGLDTDALLDELTRAIAQRSGNDRDDPRALSTSALVAHIVLKHHEYLRSALPFVQALAAKVSRVHGDHNAKLRELDSVVSELSEALLPHLDAEEQTLFPALMAAELDRTLVARELASMQEEHLAVGTLLARMRSACDDFKLPSWACTSYRTLFSELEQLEGDVLTHVHLENHVLKPRFAQG